MKHDYLTTIEISEREDAIKTNEQLEIESLKEQLAELRSIVSGVNEGLSKGLSELDCRVSKIDALLLVRGANLGDILSKIDHRFSKVDRRISNLTRRTYENETSFSVRNAKLNARLSKIETAISPRGANEKPDKEALDNSLDGINRLMFLLKNNLQDGD